MDKDRLLALLARVNERATETEAEDAEPVGADPAELMLYHRLEAAQLFLKQLLDYVYGQAVLDRNAHAKHPENARLGLPDITITYSHDYAVQAVNVLLFVVDLLLNARAVLHDVIDPHGPLPPTDAIRQTETQRKRRKGLLFDPRTPGGVQ